MLTNPLTYFFCLLLNYKGLCTFVTNDFLFVVVVVMICFDSQMMIEAS